MPALTADIGAAIRVAQIESWSSQAIKDRYPSARDGGAQPAEGFFDDPADAQAAIQARAALIGTERRRFKVTIAELWWPSLSAGVPTVTLIDPAQNVSAPALVARLEIDLENERTYLEVLV